MNNQTQQVEPLSYKVLVTEKGSWLHPAGSNFLFAYIDKTWDANTVAAVKKAYEDALLMSSKIKKAVLDTSGQTVVNGLYLLDRTAMTKAMNHVDGMGETSVDEHEKNGSGTAVSITKEFFKVILGGLGGDLEPMLSYLTTQMGEVQAQTRKTHITNAFGITVGLISIMPVLDVPVVTFQYAYSSQETSEWFTKVLCVETDHYDYDYKFTVVNYNYNKPA
ncbi:hypothetical protein [Lacinutrix salivirga]